MPPNASAVRRRNIHLILFCVIGIAIAALTGQTWWTIQQDYELTMNAQARNSAAMTRALEKHVNQILDLADQNISSIAANLGNFEGTGWPDSQQLRQILIQDGNALQALDGLWVVSQQQGQWRTLAQYPARDLDYTQMRNVEFLKTRPEHSYPVIGQPISRNQSSDWVIPVVRNAYGKDGRRIAIIGASVGVAYLADFYTPMTMEDQISITSNENGRLLLIGTPFDIRVAGEKMAGDGLVRNIFEGGQEGWFDDVSLFNDEPHLFSYRKHDRLPVTAVYAIGISGILAPWKTRSLHRIALSAAAIAFISILGSMLAAQLCRLRKSEQKLAQSEHRYHMLFEDAIDGIFLLRRDQTYIDCNSAGARMFGVESKQDVIGRQAGDFSLAATFSVPASHEDRQRRIEAALNGKPQQFELAAWRQGKLHYSEVTMSRAQLNDEEMVLCIHRDISRRKLAEDLQKDQNRILHLVAADADLQVVLNEVARFTEHRAPPAQAMILLLNEDCSRFTVGVAPSLPQQILDKLIAVPVDRATGLASEAALTKHPVLIEDIAVHSSLREQHRLLIGHGFKSCGCWPLLGKHNQALGVFLMLYRTCGTPSPDELQLVSISIDLAGIAIESRHAEERIRRLAHYDELTGLPNRFLYTQYLNKALAHAGRHPLPIAVFFLDLDRFKNINDTFGHEAGDKVLRNVARNFRACLRETDTIARVGGDEFIALIEDYSGTAQLQDIAQRLLAEATRPFEIDGQECQLSASIGIATYPEDGSDARALLKNADIAMYRAKASGRNNYQFYSAGMNSHTVERMALETSLRHAVERGEFIVHYQPRFDVYSGEIVGAEALVRWIHPEQGLILPGEFISLAEETGLIAQVGVQVLDIVCRDLHHFQEAGFKVGRIAINLSALQFNDANLLSDLRRITELRQVASSNLEFELTESAVMHNQEQAIRVMHQLRDMGLTLAIDDFGTGYSSLAYLKRLPVDSVKIDQSFIRDIPYGPKDSGIVHAIIGMAHTLGLKVVAEGVEHQHQLEALQQFGCDQYQGFYLSQAVPAHEFLLLVQKHTVQQAA